MKAIRAWRGLVSTAMLHAWTLMRILKLKVTSRALKVGPVLARSAMIIEAEEWGNYDQGAYGLCYHTMEGPQIFIYKVF